MKNQTFFVNWKIFIILAKWEITYFKYKRKSKHMLEK